MTARSEAEDALADAVARFLNRRSVPMALDGEEKAQAREDELLALTHCALDVSPGSGDLLDWWSDVERHIARNTRGRTWPTEAEIVAAALAVGKPRKAAGEEGDKPTAYGDRLTDLLASWFTRHGTECPGIGSPDRTAALVNRGVLRSLREARFRGFRLSADQLQAALEQPIDPAEWDHHVATMARLRNVDPLAAANACRAELSGALKASLPEVLRSATKRVPTSSLDGF